MLKLLIIESIRSLIDRIRRCPSRHALEQACIIGLGLSNPFVVLSALMPNGFAVLAHFVHRAASNLSLSSGIA